MRPIARRAGLVVRELPDEWIVYDLESHRAHCLNRTAGSVYRAADGSRTLTGIAQVLDGDGEPCEREAAVRLALAQLATAGLLVEPVGTRPAEAADATTGEEAAGEEPGRGRTRRDMLRRAGVGAALLLPAVISILAPPPAAAQSCLTSCGGPDPAALAGKPCTCGGPCNGTCDGVGGCSAGC